MTEAKRVRLLPIVITIVATLILSAGSFYGCGQTFMGNHLKLNAFFFYSFCVCAVTCAVSLIWLVVALAINFYRQVTEDE